MKNSQYNEIYISDTDENGTMFTGVKSGKVPIGNDTVSQSINYLFKKIGYQTIKKSGNTVSFQRLVSIRDNSAGIAFSLDGNEPKIEYGTKIEPLSEKDWYYWESDFNSWKKQNQ